VIDVAGRITLGEGSSTLRDALRDMVSKNQKKILLNLGEVSYIDSSGIGELVSGFTTVTNSGGALKLLNVPLIPPERILDKTAVTELPHLELDRGYREEEWRKLGYSSLEDFLVGNWEGGFRRRDTHLREIERLHPQQPLFGRQCRHADVHEDDAGKEPGHEDKGQDDANPSVRVDENLAPIQKLTQPHMSFLDTLAFEADGKRDVQRAGRLQPAAPGHVAQSGNQRENWQFATHSYGSLEKVPGKSCLVSRRISMMARRSASERRAYALSCSAPDSTCHRRS
jgi:anti-sigma B factor antagonist